ncbi:MAG: amino acid racemase [Ruminococcaceae bacterium]|nr:amino acid racemase [Oscillospiraceae bacterium]
MNRKPLLGIVGGLGPLASAYFYELITLRTKAEKDQDHIDIILSSRASTPDRTAYITKKSDDCPLPYMIEDAVRLEKYGADALVIPCNTAHYFLEEVRHSVSIPVPSIIEETSAYLKKAGYKKAGIMATAGTVSSGSYQEQLSSFGLDYAVPDEKYQEYLHDLIYGSVKKGEKPNLYKFYAIAEHLIQKGCDKLILGCTELSVINRDIGGDKIFIDSLEVLAHCAITLCGHETTGFPEEFDL